MTDPARESDLRSSAQDELDAILREAKAVRRQDHEEAHDVVDLPPVSEEPRPRLTAVPGRAPVSAPAPARPNAARGLPTGSAEIRFDTFDIKLSDPGEMKFKALRPSMRAIAALLLGVVAAAVWISSPNGAGLLRPNPLPESYNEASARWAMVIMADRIDRFRAERQRLPETLEELGPAPSELIGYERLAEGTYRLQAPGSTAPLTLGGSTSREIFAANSVDILRLGPDKAP